MSRSLIFSLIFSWLFTSGSVAYSSDMNEQDYDQALARIESTHQKFFTEKNQRLEIESDWVEGIANAFADRIGETFILEVYGGLARHPLITTDAFSLLVCHELGHHIGGAPTPKGYQWPTLEGQADFFAALKCMKRVLAEDPAAPAVVLGAPATIDAILSAKCAKSFENPTDRRICERIGMAGLSAANFFHGIEKKGLPPNFATPDLTQVPKTLTSHARSQCRLDTYLAAATCSTDLAINPHPTDSSKESCERPRCWFKP